MPSGYRKDGTKIIPPSLKGKYRSEKTKRKISETNKKLGKRPPIQWGNKFRLNKKHSEETKRKMRESHKGHLTSEETRKKIGLGNKGKKRTEEVRKKYSEARKGKPSSKGMLGKKQTEKQKRIMRGYKGEKSWNWKGGQKRYKHTANTFEYKLWRSKIFQRDNWTCQTCDKRSQSGELIYLEAHHIKSWAKYPELRFDINNGITLCKECHLLLRKKL